MKILNGHLSLGDSCDISRRLKCLEVYKYLTINNNLKKFEEYFFKTLKKKSSFNKDQYFDVFCSIIGLKENMTTYMLGEKYKLKPNIIYVKFIRMLQLFDEFKEIEDDGMSAQ